MISLSEDQEVAAKSIKKWIRSGTKKKQVFRLFGYAGTGKSTILKHILEDCGLSPHEKGRPGFVAATFTGKAALVLSRMGIQGAQTIHSLIYRVVGENENAIEETEKSLVRAIRDAENAIDGMKGIYLERAARIRESLSKMKEPKFVINYDSVASECKLIVLDEVSMVPDDMAADLLSFGKPILVIGDPEQLPPINGDGFFVREEPDVFLREIHRQARDNPIIRLASMVRTGEEIEFGKHGEKVIKIRKESMTAEKMLRGDCQVICGRNSTRLSLNNDIRKYQGFNDILPVPGDKVICIRNNNDYGIVNGMFIRITKIIDEGKTSFIGKIEMDEDYVAESKNQILPLYKGYFEDHRNFDSDRRERDWKAMRGLIESTFGWAITCHKAQGSQWKNVIVMDERIGKTKEDRRKWLYTAITRAQEGLVIAS